MSLDRHHMAFWRHRADRHQILNTQAESDCVPETIFPQKVRWTLHVRLGQSLSAEGSGGCCGSIQAFLQHSEQLSCMSSRRGCFLPLRCRLGRQLRVAAARLQLDIVAALIHTGADVRSRSDLTQRGPQPGSVECAAPPLGGSLLHVCCRNAGW